MARPRGFMSFFGLSVIAIDVLSVSLILFAAFVESRDPKMIAALLIWNFAGSAVWCALYYFSGWMDARIAALKGGKG